jgi:hypothetical protein
MDPLAFICVVGAELSPEPRPRELEPVVVEFEVEFCDTPLADCPEANEFELGDEEFPEMSLVRLSKPAFAILLAGGLLSTERFESKPLPEEFYAPCAPILALLIFELLKIC